MSTPLDDGSDNCSDHGSEHLLGCSREHNDGEPCYMNHSGWTSHLDGEQPPPVYPPPPGVHSNCAVCDENYYTVETQQNAISDLNIESKICTLYKGYFITEEAAQQSLYTVIKGAIEDFEYIRGVLRSHGDLVMSRWTKKSKDKRGVLLDSASDVCFGNWPPITKRQLAPWVEDPLFLEEPISPGAMIGSGFCSTWINIEELAGDRMKLLAFLHVRCENPPCDWASFDAHGMKRYFLTPVNPLMFNAKCVEISGENYGHMVPFDVELIHSGKIVGFPRAWATAWVQQYMSSALREVVDKLVAGAPPSGDVKWSRLVSDGFRNHVGGPMFGVYDNQLFASPSRFDPETLLEMASDQLNRVVDEVELLQGDQEYLRDHASTMKANISWDASVSSSLKWSYISGTIAALWTDRLSRWQIIVDRSQKLVNLCRNRSVTNQVHVGLPSDIKTAIIDYGLMLRDMLEIELVHLRSAVSNMHAMKDTYSKHASRGVLFQKFDYEENFSKPGNRIAYVEQMLLVHLSLRRHSGLAHGALRNFEAELAKVKPDRHVSEASSAIALLDAMQNIWRLGHVMAEDELRSSSIDGDMAEKRLAAVRSQHGLFKTCSDEKRYERLGSILRDFCESPWPKNRGSATWLDKRLEIRKLQGEFWRVAREDWQQHQHELQGDVVGAVVGHMSFAESPRYVAEVEAERASFEAELRQSQESNIRKKEVKHIPQSVWGVEPEKIKRMRTRPKSADPAEEPGLEIAAIDLNEEHVADTVQTPAKPLIPVKQDSKRIFDKMFSRNSTASNFRWTHLINALIDAGMTATQSAGSAVRFKNEHGSVVFHHPHGENHESTLSAEFLRNQVGKRLTKWFSWDSETFVERKKDE